MGVNKQPSLHLLRQADLAAQDGWTPLHHAAAGGHSEIVRALISKKADKSRKSLVRGEEQFCALPGQFDSFAR